MRTLAVEVSAMRLAFQDTGLNLSKSKAGLKSIKQFWKVTRDGERILKRQRVHPP